jgi:2-iminobutanoate/2-iminopropanoate deaminase
MVWRRVIETGVSKRLGVPLSQAIVFGDLIFVSGQTAYDPITGEIRHGTFEEEARMAFSNLKRVLEMAGSGLAYVIKVNAYLANIKSNFSEYNRIYREVFEPPYPARTTIGADLAGLQIEIEAIACLASGERMEERGEDEI